MGRDDYGGGRDGWMDGWLCLGEREWMHRYPCGPLSELILRETISVANDVPLKVIMAFCRGTLRRMTLSLASEDL